MPPRRPLPATLSDVAFTVAAGRSAGLSEGRMRGADLDRPFHGVRVPRRPELYEAGSESETGSDNELVRTRCLAYVPLLRPGQFFSHDTASRLWDAPLPGHPRATDPLHLSVLAPGRAPRSRGISGHQALATHPVVRNGLPVSDPTTTWLAMAAELPLDELVVLADHLVLEPYQLDPNDIRPWVTLADLTTAAHDFRGRGGRRAASAIPLIRPGSESRPETLLRLLLGRAGLPEPRVNIDVTDASGRFIGRGDLVWPEFRTIAEYDGDHHRTDSRQYDVDITRIERFVHADYTVVRVRAHALFAEPRTTVSRVERALTSRGWSR